MTIETPSRRVLVIDDVPDFLRTMSKILRPYFQVSICSSPLRAIRMASKGGFDLVVTTLVMKETDGFEVIRRIRGSGSHTPIIMITGYGNDGTAIEATRLGASDYLSKPVAPDELIARIRRVLSQQEEAGGLGKLGRSPVISRSPEMRALLNMIERAATAEGPVLLVGETGTGKEMVAKLLHANGHRASEPFVEVNCASIPRDMMEDEFFGHERGAVAGASELRHGRFEEAGGGMLFLNEIAELTLSMQSKLLRVLQAGSFSRIGGMYPIRCEARIVAASNRNLEEEVRAGRFRGDLYIRLNPIMLRLPPLRHRKEDIPLLTEHFIRKFAATAKERIHFPPYVMRLLNEYSWPGNIRELEHIVERLSVLHPGSAIEADMLPTPIYNASLSVGHSIDIPNLVYKQARAEFQKVYFQRVIAEAGGNLAEAARIAGMERSNFFRKAKSLGFTDKPTEKSGPSDNEISED